MREISKIRNEMFEIGLRRKPITLESPSADREHNNMINGAIFALSWVLAIKDTPDHLGGESLTQYLDKKAQS